jgi:Zn-dependent protease
MGGMAAEARARGRLALFGIPFFIDPGWFFIVALLAWTLARGYFPATVPGGSAGLHWGLGAAAAVLLFVCVILHELGHSLVARAHRIPVLGITLYFFGGVSHLGRDPLRPSAELQVALAGPLVSAVLVAGCIMGSVAVGRDSEIALVSTALLRYLAAVNFAILCFNLLPAFPLDGGRVLRAVLWKMTGNWSRATSVAAAIGALFGISLAAYGGWTMVVNRATVSGVWCLRLGWHLFGVAQGIRRRTT